MGRSREPKPKSSQAGRVIKNWNKRNIRFQDSKKGIKTEERGCQGKKGAFI